MPAARAQQKRLKKGAQGAGLRYGAQMGGPVGKGRYANQMRGPGGPGGLPQRGRMDSELGAAIQAKMAIAGGPGDRGPGGLAGRLGRAGGGQPEQDIGVQGPAVMPPDAAAKPIPAGPTGGSGASADVGTGGTGTIDMGPTPKGVQDAGAGGGGRVVRPGTGLIQPPAPSMPAPGEAVPAAGPLVAQAAPMAKEMAMRQPMSGFQPRKRKPGGANRFFTGA